MNRLIKILALMVVTVLLLACLRSEDPIIVDVTPSSLIFDAAGGQDTVYVQSYKNSNGEYDRYHYKLGSDDDWISIESLDGDVPNTFVISVSENMGVDARELDIHFTIMTKYEGTLHITQKSE